jgi:hypothetical protein
MKTKAEAVAEIAGRREKDDKEPDARYVFGVRGTHRLVVYPPTCCKEAFGGGTLYVDLTPGHDLPFHLRELAIAIGNARTEARKERFDRPGEINS